MFLSPAQAANKCTFCSLNCNSATLLQHFGWSSLATWRLVFPPRAGWSARERLATLPRKLSQITCFASTTTTSPIISSTTYLEKVCRQWAEKLVSQLFVCLRKYTISGAWQIQTIVMAQNCFFFYLQPFGKREEHKIFRQLGKKFHIEMNTYTSEWWLENKINASSYWTLLKRKTSKHHHHNFDVGSDNEEAGNVGVGGGEVDNLIRLVGAPS